jgi:predicted glycoside hydrolase/deacetylase ChbG (UPF0249 family)
VEIVLNADDFGYSRDTVDATIKCFDEGLLTSATIMARMPATDLALAFAREHRNFSFGVHLTFVGDGFERAVSPPSSVRALADENGCFPRSRPVRLRALAGRLPVEQIELEVAAQIDAVRDAGIEVTHVDSHRHLHKFGPFREALRRVLPRYGIARVRNVQDVYLKRPLRSPTFWLGRAWRRDLARSFTTTDHFYMPTSAHDAAWARVASIVDVLPGRTLEVGLHPGSDEEWRRRELASLRPFCEEALGGGHRLVSWDSIPVIRTLPVRAL